MQPPRDLLLPLVRLVEEAGARVAKAFEGDFKVEWKGPRDPVTEVDKAVNAFLCERLSAMVPEAGIVAEESDETENAAAQSREVLLFVDPIDGTQEFVDRRQEFGVLLGMVVGDRPVLGIVHVPMAHTTYYSVAGEGAFKVIGGGPAKPLAVSKTSALSEAHALVTRTHGSERLERALAHLGVHKRICGSAGLKAARIADGDGDVWVSPGPAGMRWDVAGAEVILAEAGGKLTDGHGRPFDYRRGLKNEAGILASNGLLHERAVASMLFAEREP